MLLIKMPWSRLGWSISLTGRRTFEWGRLASDRTCPNGGEADSIQGQASILIRTAELLSKVRKHFSLFISVV